MVDKNTELLDIAYLTLDVIRLLEEGKPVPMSYFKAKVKAAIERATVQCCEFDTIAGKNKTTVIHEVGCNG